MKWAGKEDNMKIVGKILGTSAITLGLLFAVYYYNLDMKLMRSVVIPLLNKHHDSVKREHLI